MVPTSIVQNGTLLKLDKGSFLINCSSFLNHDFCSEKRNLNFSWILGIAWFLKVILFTSYKKNWSLLWTLTIAWPLEEKNFTFNKKN